ncbi:MAG: lysophospholipid acyltransferase family protein [Myxococcales bacterium]|nr:lysophospholipid acyltransferase family protein [Myxococcales bacterium]
MRARLAAALAVGVGALLASLPGAWARALGAALGAAWHRLLPIRRRVARENVARALGGTPAEVRRVVARAYRHFGVSLVELLRAAAGRPAPLEIVGEAHLAEALAAGRGALVLSAHLGAFEALVRAGGRFPVPVHVVTRRLRSPTAQAIWRRLRRGGASLLPAGASARETVAALRRGEIVAYVLDQHAPPGRAVWVPFFGRPAATSPDLVRLARRLGAPVVPIFTHRLADGRHRVDIGAPVELTRGSTEAALVADTTRCVAVVEAAIRAHPTQWLWIHRRWKPAPADVAAALAEDGVAGRRRTLRAGADPAARARPGSGDPGPAPPPTAGERRPDPPGAPGRSPG